MPKLLELPDETLTGIMRHFDSSDLPNLRLTCRKMYGFCISERWDAVCFRGSPKEVLAMLAPILKQFKSTRKLPVTLTKVKAARFIFILEKLRPGQPRQPCPMLMEPLGFVIRVITKVSRPLDLHLEAIGLSPLQAFDLGALLSTLLNIRRINLHSLRVDELAWLVVRERIDLSNVQSLHIPAVAGFSFRVAAPQHLEKLHVDEVRNFSIHEAGHIQQTFPHLQVLSLKGEVWCGLKWLRHFPDLDTMLAPFKDMAHLTELILTVDVSRSGPRLRNNFDCGDESIRDWFYYRLSKKCLECLPQLKVVVVRGLWSFVYFAERLKNGDEDENTDEDDETLMWGKAPETSQPEHWLDPPPMAEEEDPTVVS